MSDFIDLHQLRDDLRAILDSLPESLTNSLLSRNILGNVLQATQIMRSPFGGTLADGKPEALAMQVGEMTDCTVEQPRDRTAPVQIWGGRTIHLQIRNDLVGKVFPGLVPGAFLPTMVTIYWSEDCIRFLVENNIVFLVLVESRIVFEEGKKCPQKGYTAEIVSTNKIWNVLEYLLLKGWANIDNFTPTHTQFKTNHCDSKTLVVKGVSTNSGEQKVFRRMVYPYGQTIGWEETCADQISGESFNPNVGDASHVMIMDGRPDLLLTKVGVARILKGCPPFIVYK